MQVCIFGPGEMDIGRQSIFFSDRELQTDTCMTNIGRLRAHFIKYYFGLLWAFTFNIEEISLPI